MADKKTARKIAPIYPSPIWAGTRPRDATTRVQATTENALRVLPVEHRTSLNATDQPLAVVGA